MVVTGTIHYMDLKEMMFSLVIMVMIFLLVVLAMILTFSQLEWDMIEFMIVRGKIILK